MRPVKRMGQGRKAGNQASYNDGEVKQQGHASVPELEESEGYTTAPMRKKAHTTELELHSRGWEPSRERNKLASGTQIGAGPPPDADPGTAEELHGSILIQCRPSRDLQQQ